MSLRERLTRGDIPFTRSEVKVVRELVANYPAAALTSVSRLARRAGVSDPTVGRLAAKLGFRRFADLQAVLLGEVEAHLNSPLTMLSTSGRDIDDKDLPRAYLAASAATLSAMAHEVLPAEFEAAAALLADHRRHVCCLGGRFSGHLAAILKWHLQQLRPGAELLTAGAADLADRLIDLGPRDLLAVYDFRRYQADVVLFAQQAAEAGCKVILFTDRWRSPIARSADIVLTVPVETISPFDTMVPALVLTEGLIAAVTRRLGPRLKDRIARLESDRSRYRVTLGTEIADPPAPAGRRRRVVPPDRPRALAGKGPRT